MVDPFSRGREQSPSRKRVALTLPSQGSGESPSSSWQQRSTIPSYVVGPTISQYDPLVRCRSDNIPERKRVESGGPTSF